MAETYEEAQGLHMLHLRSIYTRMARHPELCVLIAGMIMNVIVNYSTSIKPKPVTAPPKFPKHFFPVGSSVTDFHFGTVGNIPEMILEDEVLFVMYYAPWCAQSMSVRPEFQKAAKVMQSKVQFIAVNCWWHQGHCRQHYKFYRFPELYLYHTHLNGFRYSGPMKADYIVKFLEEIIYPVTLLHSSDEILQFVSKQDNTLIGYFDFHASPQPPGYAQFYFTSMRFLEIDSLQPVKCAVLAQQDLALELGMTGPKQVVFVRSFNKTLLYPLDHNFTSSDLQKWTFKYQQKPVVSWLAPPGHKSLTLSMALEEGPALLMFAPVNQLLANNFYYNQLREVGMLYRKCNDSGVLINTFIQFSIKGRKDLEKLYNQDIHNCRHHSHEETVSNVQGRNCCMSLVERQKNIGLSSHSKRICEFCRYIEKNIPISRVKPCTLDIFSTSYFDAEAVFSGIQTPSCMDISSNYNAQEYRTLCCKQCSQEMPDSACASQPFRQSTDSFVQNSFSNLCKHICRKLSLQKYSKLLSPIEIGEDLTFDFVPENFTGLSCRTNKSLNLLFLDEAEHSLFADRILYNGTDRNISMPTVIIIDAENEVHFDLRESLSRLNIAKFMLDFTYNSLSRHLRSEPLPVSCDNRTEVCIQDLSSPTFQDVVMQNNKDVLLLVYATWCGFCAAFSHTYIALAKYFTSARDIIFARINADVNDLPWEYTVDHYPSLIFFPANRKSDSVVFPDHISKSLPNLIKFVLAHAATDLRIDLATDICTRECIRNNLQHTRIIIVNLRHRKSSICKRIIISYHIGNSHGSQSVPVSKDVLRILWQRMSKVQRQLKRAFALQKLLSENSEGLPKAKLKQYFESSSQTKEGYRTATRRPVHTEL